MDNMSITTSERYSAAYKLHGEILAYGENCATALVGLCKSLKEMRDKKLYADLGMSGFDEYCEQMCGIKARMAYNYISAYEHYGESVLQSNANIGITKLSLLAQLPPKEEKELLCSDELAGMSVADIKRLIEEKKDFGEQLELFKNEKKTAEQEIAELKEQISAQKAEIENLKDAVPVVTPAPEVDEAALRKQIKAELAEDNRKKIDKAVKAELDKQREEIEKAAADKAKADAAAVINELSAEKARAEELKKQLAMSDSKQTTVKIYFDGFQDAFKQLVNAVAALDDEQKERYKQAISTALDKLKGML